MTTEITDAQAAAEATAIANGLADAGATALSLLGFTMTEPAAVQVNIGTDEHPDEAQIILTWPLPPEVRSQPDTSRLRDRHDPALRAHRRHPRRVLSTVNAAPKPPKGRNHHETDCHLRRRCRRPRRRRLRQHHDLELSRA